MAHPVMFKIDQAGNVTFLVGERTKGLVPEARKPLRASHVEPYSLTLKIMFRALRKAFGEDGRVGNWTRTWKTSWTVDLRPVGGDVWSMFSTREAAIDFEIDWLNKNFLGVK